MDEIKKLEQQYQESRAKLRNIIADAAMAYADRNGISYEKLIESFNNNKFSTVSSVPVSKSKSISKPASKTKSNFPAPKKITGPDGYQYNSHYDMVKAFSEGGLPIAKYDVVVWSKEKKMTAKLKASYEALMKNRAKNLTHTPDTNKVFTPIISSDRKLFESNENEHDARTDANGRVFKSVAEMCDFHKVPVSDYLKRRANGMSKRAALQP